MDFLSLIPEYTLGCALFPSVIFLLGAISWVMRTRNDHSKLKLIIEVAVRRFLWQLLDTLFAKENSNRSQNLRVPLFRCTLVNLTDLQKLTILLNYVNIYTLCIYMYIYIRLYFPLTSLAHKHTHTMNIHRLLIILANKGIIFMVFCEIPWPGKCLYHNNKSGSMTKFFTISRILLFISSRDDSSWECAQHDTLYNTVNVSSLIFSIIKYGEQLVELTIA